MINPYRYYLQKNREELLRRLYSSRKKQKYFINLSYKNQTYFNGVYFINIENYNPNNSLRKDRENKHDKIKF